MSVQICWLEMTTDLFQGLPGSTKRRRYDEQPNGSDPSDVLPLRVAANYLDWSWLDRAFSLWRCLRVRSATLPSANRDQGAKPSNMSGERPVAAVPPSPVLGAPLGSSVPVGSSLDGGFPKES